MTNEQINDAMAKAHLGVFPWVSKEGNVGGWTNADGDDCDAPPDYCNDLNAMHEAEKALIAPHQEAFVYHLIDDKHALIRGCVYESSVFKCAHATARQRAEAFLRTVGKWEETAK